MKLVLLVVGKTDEKYLQEGISKFEKRLKHYLPFEMEVLQDIKNVKNLSQEQQKEKEGELILKQIKGGDFLVLLDEKGKEFTSRGLADYFQKQMLSGIKRLIFVIGGPYGFSKDVYQQAQGKITLSRLTFSHQMVRLICVEQFYRAMTILKGEPYHHD